MIINDQKKKQSKIRFDFGRNQINKKVLRRSRSRIFKCKYICMFFLICNVFIHIILFISLECNKRGCKDGL